MSKKFIPVKQESVEIYGKDYFINANNVTFIKNFQKKKSELFEAIEIVKAAEGSEQVDNAVTVFLEVIDLILGEGEGDRIYEQANKDIFQIVQVLQFLTNEINEQRATSIKKYHK